MTPATRKKIIAAELALLLCGVIWGGGFVVMKKSLDYFSINFLLATRFLLAGGILAIVLFKNMLRTDKNTALGGLFAGAALYCAFLTQTIGLSTTTAGNNAFLTTTYIIFVPLLTWVFFQKKPGGYTIFAALLCISGVGMIALDSQLSISVGDAWTLISGVFFAVHILIIKQFTSKGVPVLTITAYQFIFAGALALLSGLLFEAPPAFSSIFSSDALIAMAYLVLLATIYGLVMQNIGVSLVPASHASLLLSTEALFGFLAGVIFLGEPLTLRFITGALLIFGGLLLSEFGGHWISKRMQNTNEDSITAPISASAHPNLPVCELEE